MALVLQSFESDPQILPVTGGRVDFVFVARTTGSPTHLRARFWISPQEGYVFTPAETGEAREVFWPAANQQAVAPSSFAALGPKTITVLPAGAVDPSRTQPLQINLEVQGYDANGQPDGGVRVERCLLTIATLSMALGALSNHLGLTQAELSSRLDVAPSTLRSAMRTGRSEKVRSALDRILRGD